MKSFARTCCLAAAAAALAAVTVLGADRADIAERYTWNLADIYPSVQAWTQARGDVQKRIGDLAPFKGHLGDSPRILLEALRTQEKLEKDMYRVYAYASMLSDQDTRVSEHTAMKQSAEELATEYGAAAAFIQPEVLSLDADTIRGFMASEPGLEVYKPYLDDILRMKAHTLTPDQEQIVARAGAVAVAPGAIYKIFTAADMPRPEITLSNGETVRLDAAGYARYRSSKVRADRDKVFKAFWQGYEGYRRTLGTTLYSHVKAHIFNKDVRHYDSSLAASLDANNIPVAVYTRLIEDVHSNLPTLHRYLRLRKRMMHLDQLRYEDLYAPIVSEVDITYTPDQAMDLVLKAVAPLGSDYTTALRKGFDSRWVDFYPSTGKRSGAYSTGIVYDVHPYQLLNFNGRYDDVSTLAHESGHSMHSYLSNKNQTFANAHYATFVAEVASTLNENLLFHYMMDHTTDKAARLYILGEHLEGYRQTLFRQTLFAEFEMRIHEMAEKGQPLTGDSMSKLYLDLLRTYYGHEEGVCKIDELYGNEWAYIPHFYRNFYVYQYATSLTASTALANRILGEAPSVRTRDAYLAMLSSGSVKYPVDLLKDAGVDMTTSLPFDEAVKDMNRTMDQIEAILNGKA